MSNGVLVTDLTIVRSGQRVLDALSLTLVPGTAYALVGPNGSGKSTLLHALAGLIPHEGEVRRPDAASLMSALPGYHRDRTLANHVHLVARRPGVDTQRLIRLVEEFQLESLWRRRPRAMSLGQQRAVGLLEPLAQQGRTILLDEPFLALDAQRVDVLERIIKQLADAGKIIVVSSHELAPLSRCCTELIMLTKGALTFQGSLSRFITGARPIRFLVHPVDPNAWSEAVVHQPGVHTVPAGDGRYVVEGLSMAELLDLCFRTRVQLAGIWEETMTLADALTAQTPAYGGCS